MTPWPGMMRMAARLGVGPEAFWRLSLREWRWLTEALEGERPMGRGELKRLTEAWPDERDVRAG